MSGVNVKRDYEGTTLTRTQSSNVHVYPINNNYNFSTPFTVNFNVITYSGIVIVRINNGTAVDKYFSGLGLTRNNNVRIEATSSQIKYYVDNILKDSVNNTGGNSYVDIILNNGSVKYNYFQIYSLM